MCINQQQSRWLAVLLLSAVMTVIGFALIGAVAAQGSAPQAAIEGANIHQDHLISTRGSPMGPNPIPRDSTHVSPPWREPHAPNSGVVGNGTPGSCTEAALDAALAGGGTITFNCGSSPITITVTSQKVITAPTFLDGGALVTLSGGDATRIFSVDSGVSLTLVNLTLSNGFASSTSGGAVVNNGTLSVVNNTFSNNNADAHGGAIGNYGALSVSDSTFTNNTAGINGGAIDTTVTATITSTLFMSNTAGFRGGSINNYLGVLTILEGRFVGNMGNAYGGGITNDGGTLTVMGSQFSGNTSGDFGGGLRNSGTASVFDSTFAFNTASNKGGAIENSGSLSLVNSTVSGNSAGNMGSGGLENAGSASVLFSTLVSNTSTSAFGGNIANSNALDIKASIVAFGGALNCSGPLTSLGYNVESSNFCNFNATGDLQNTNPLLGALADNGGPTLTHTPLTDSPALERVPMGDCIPVDQRGLKRPQGTQCDAGAVEVAVREPIVSTANTMPWAMFGHDTRRTERGNTPGPDDPKRLGAPWPYLAAGRIGTSPAIDFAGTAYVGSDDTMLHAVDRFGVQHFTFRTGGPVRSSPAIVPVDFGPIFGETYVPPLTSTIYFGSDDGHVYAIDSTGALKWSLAPGGNTSPVRSSPAALKRPAMMVNRIYVGADNGKLYALFETGSMSATLQWELTTSAPLTTSAALSPDGVIVYVGGTDGTLYCVDALTGAPLPNTPIALGLGTLTTPAVDKGGIVYMGSASGVVRSFTRLCEPRPYFHPNLSARINAGPAIAPNGDVFIIAGNTLYGISNLGNVIWSQPFALAIGRVAPIVDSVGTAYVVAENGSLYAVVRRRGTNQGTIKWSISIATGNTYLGAPALDGWGRIYLGASDNRLDVIDDEPAFQIAFHSDISQTANLDIYSLRETYGLLDPSRTQRLTDHSAAERQPAYSLDRSVMGYVSNRALANDGFIADAVGSNEDNLTKPRANAPFTNSSAETEPAFTPLDNLTGISRLPDQKRYMALTSNASGVERIFFVDLGAYELGNTRVLSLTAWAMAQGVPISITSQLEPPNRTQSAIAFSPDGKRVAWRDCDVNGTSGAIQLLTLNSITSTLTSAGPFFFDPESRAAWCGDSPAFAPDSRWLVFREDKTITVWDTQGLTTLFHTPGPLNGTPTHPNWSPDGSEIAVGLVTPTNSVDVFVLSSAQYTTFARLTTSGTSDEPFYHFYKMPPPQALALRPDRQFPGEAIQILGRGFDILNPQNNKVYFTDTLHMTWLPAQVLGASVDPYAGLGVLTVKVPDLAGSGNIKVETRFGVSVCCMFYVLPKPASIVQARSVPGARVRVFGLGFDQTPASQNRVLFTGITGTTWMTGTVISGTVVGQQEFLVVQVPQGITETGKIRVETTQGGSDCACTFTQLHPTLSVRRVDGLPSQADEGCDGIKVELNGENFPFDSFFNYGVQANVVVQPQSVPMGSAPLSQSFSAPDTARIISFTLMLPTLPITHPGGNINIVASDAQVAAANAAAPFRVPLKNIPIIFVPGTSGNSLDTSMPFSNSVPFDVHWFPWVCKACLLGFAEHWPRTFTYNPATLDPRGPRVWIGPEMVNELKSFWNLIDFNAGNHYLDVLAYDNLGRNTLFPQIQPGTVFTDVVMPNGTSDFIYDSLIESLRSPDVNWTGRPLCLAATGTCRNQLGMPMSGTNGIYLFAYDFRNEIPGEASRLGTFVDAVLNRADVKAAGITKVAIITHSYGGPVTRGYYLTGTNAPQKVDQVISIGGGFLGVPKPIKVLIMGDTWGDQSHALAFYQGAPSSISWGIAEWQTEALSRNWPTAYFQAPSSQDWFFDDGTTISGKKIDRSYIRDGRVLVGAGDIHSHTVALNWLSSNFNATIVARTRNFYAALPVSMGDFRNGTSGIYHYRIIGKGLPTNVASKLFTGWSDACLYAVAKLDSNLALIECFPITRREPVDGDGDATVPYHGALGLIDSREERVFIANDGTPGMDPEHFAMTKNSLVQQLVRSLLAGTVCRQAQSPNFLAPNQVTEKLNVASTSESATPQSASSVAEQWRVEVRSTVQLDVYDAAGHHLGSNASDPSQFDWQIPNATYKAQLGFTTASIRQGGAYTFTLSGVSPSAADIRLSALDANGLMNTTLFQWVPMTTTSRATLVVNTDLASPPLVVQHDFAGNGQTQTITPTATLDPQQSADSVLPTTTLSIANGIMTLAATDNPGGSGMLRTYYRVDEGPFVVYSAPVTLPATWGTISAFSVDRNGNIEAPGASVSRSRIFLPLMVKNF